MSAVVESVWVGHLPVQSSTILNCIQPRCSTHWTWTTASHTSRSQTHKDSTFSNWLWCTMHQI